MQKMMLSALFALVGGMAFAVGTTSAAIDLHLSVGEGVRDRRPVEYLAYTTVRGNDLYPARPADSTVFGVLRQRSGLSVDLPGEFQWEWMALSGTDNLNTGYNTGIASSVVSGKDANYPGRYQYNGGYIDGTTAPARTCGPENGTAYVGSYAPSKWGFYDCHGNVNEMCLDYYADHNAGKYLIPFHSVRIPEGFLEDGKYKLLKLGRSAYASDMWFVWTDTAGRCCKGYSPLSLRMISRCFDSIRLDRQFETWISIRAEGPKFFPGDRRENRIFVEQIFSVAL